MAQTTRDESTSALNIFHVAYNLDSKPKQFKENYDNHLMPLLTGQARSVQPRPHDDPKRAPSRTAYHVQAALWTWFPGGEMAAAVTYDMMESLGRANECPESWKNEDLVS